MTSITHSSVVYPREARQRDLVDFLVRNKNKAYNYVDIALAMRTTTHTAREIVRKLKREGKVLVKHMGENRRIHTGRLPKNVRQNIAYVTINRYWLNRHKEETMIQAAGEKAAIRKALSSDDDDSRSNLQKRT